jgi:hypothetical protein
MQNPQEQLAQMYIEEYLRTKGLTMKSVRELPEEQARKVMIEASTYAATKLCEVEKRAQMMSDLKGVTGASGQSFD